MFIESQRWCGDCARYSLLFEHCSLPGKKAKRDTAACDKFVTPNTIRRGRNEEHYTIRRRPKP